MHLAAHTFDSSTGYGNWATMILHGLEALGHNVTIVSGIPIPEELKRFEKRTAKIPDIIVYPPFTVSKALVQFTTYESTKLTDEMRKQLRKRKLIVTLCEQNRQLFLSANKNVKVCHPATAIRYTLPKNLNLFTFFHGGADNSVPERKRSADVVKAFIKAFPKEEDVALIVKKDSVDPKIVCFDKRIELIYGKQTSLLPYYEAAHVGVFPCGQEGWGYCQAEMMGIGRPLIVPFYGGPADFCNEVSSYSLPYTMRPTPKKVYNSVGSCAYVKTDDIAKAMRFCYENREDTILKGVHSYRQMMGFTKDHMLAQLADILENL